MKLEKQVQKNFGEKLVKNVIGDKVEFPNKESYKITR